MTLLLDLLYFAIVALVLAVALFAAINTGLRMRSARHSDETVPALMWRYRLRLTILTVFLFLILIGTSRETAYRPKVSINPSNPDLDARLKAVDEAKPQVTPATIRPTWEELQQKNREQNKAVVEEFNKLPSTASK